MAINTVAAFVDAVRQHRLLEPEQLDEVGRVQGRTTDPRALAKALIQKGWLTPYQVNQIFQGQAASLVMGQYRILERLGEGGMGQVFKARHQAMGRVVALKVIRKERLENVEAVKRFHREIQAASKLTHPNIVLAFDADAVGSTHYLAMEYVEGIDLTQLVKQQGPLPVAQACEYIRQAALGLQYAHEKGMVHRDIKPSNLLLERASGANGKAGESSSPKRGKSLVKILDMGLARLQPHENEESLTQLSMDGSVMGTPDFMAPEQAKNSHRVDHRADIYSLGCAFYYLLTREPPFPGGSNLEKLIKHQMDPPRPLKEFRPDVPPGVQQALDRMLAKRPEDRFQSCAEVAAALAPFGEGGAPETMTGIRGSLPPAAPVATAAATAVTATGTAVAAPPGTDLVTTIALAQSEGVRRRSARSSRQPVIFAALAVLLLGGISLLVWAVSSSRKEKDPVAAATARETKLGAVPRKVNEPPPLQRLVPDETSAVVLLNVPDVLKSPVFRHSTRRLGIPMGRVRDDLVREFGIELDSLQRLVLTTPGGGRDAEALFLLQGSFDAEKVRSALQQQSATTHKVKGTGDEGRYYEVVDTSNGLPRYYAALVGPGALAISKEPAVLAHILEKVLDPKKGGLKDRDLANLIDKPDLKAPVQVLVGGSFTFDRNGQSIGDSPWVGIRSINGVAQLGEGVDLKFTVSCMSESAAKGLDAFLKFLLSEMAKNREAAPIAQALRMATVTIKEDKTTVVVEHNLSGRDIERLLPPPR